MVLKCYKLISSPLIVCRRPRRFWFILVLVHQMAVSLFRLIGVLARSQVVASTVGWARLPFCIATCANLSADDDIRGCKQCLT